MMKQGLSLPKLVAIRIEMQTFCLKMELERFEEYNDVVDGII